MAPRDGLADARVQFSSGTESLQKASDDFRNDYNKLVNKTNSLSINNFQAWYYGDDIDEIMHLFGVASEGVSDILYKTDTILRGSVPVFSLLATAFDWVEIEGSISSLAVRAKEPAVWSFCRWEGKASEAYREIRDSQWRALVGLGGSAGGIGTWLEGVASSNVNFMLVIIEPIIEINKLTLAAIIDAVSIAGVLEAIGVLSLAIAEAATSISAIVRDAMVKAEDTIGRSLEADRILSDNGTFPGGKWPNPVRV